MPSSPKKPSPEMEKCLSVLTPEQKELIVNLYSNGQSHLFKNFNEDTSPVLRRRFAEQLVSLDKDYSDGGLLGYISNAKKLLEASRKGVNPLEGWQPSVPQGETFEIGTSQYSFMETGGLTDIGKVGFVLVAGGLGERLGYGGIKVGLPTETSTGTCYLQYYIEYILAVQKKYADGLLLELCIMTSGDTNDATIELLENNDYFGMTKEQVTIVQQGQGVPALTDNEAKLAFDEVAYKIMTKPHGHGDIHELLYRHGVAKDWFEKGLKWLVLFQDTNGLGMHTLPVMLGISQKYDLIMNSLAVPRKAKQAIGAITKLDNPETGESRTINVEYNMLDPLLRATVSEEGDVNDETGFSPYPGNINQILFQLEGYTEALEKSKGLMPEFVNPKYKDEAKTIFKKPTRLECMMQDFPTVLEGDNAKRVGFTSIAADMCFSPVKNATADGAVLQAKGTPPGTAATGEADQYGAVRKIMQSIGCQIEDAPERSFAGIKVTPGPAIVVSHDFACCPGEYKKRFPTPEKIKISAKSTLIIKGSNVVIQSLDLDGAMVIECTENKDVLIKKKVVKNDGWVYVDDESSDEEIIKMRGYRIEKKETENIILNNEKQHPQQQESGCVIQ